MQIIRLLQKKEVQNLRLVIISIQIRQDQNVNTLQPHHYQRQGILRVDKDIH